MYGHYQTPKYPGPYMPVDKQYHPHYRHCCEQGYCKGQLPQIAYIKPAHSILGQPPLPNTKLCNFANELAKPKTSLGWQSDPRLRNGMQYNNLNGEKHGSVLKNMASFWTNVCYCDRKPFGYKSEQAEVVNYNNMNNDCVLSRRCGDDGTRDFLTQNHYQVQAKTCLQAKKNDDKDNLAQVTLLQSDKVTQQNKNDENCQKGVTEFENKGFSYIEKLTDKLQQAQDKIFELDHQNLLLEQSISSMMYEMNQSMQCLQQAEAVMDSHYVYSTALLSSVIDFCCSLSSPSVHPDVRHAVREFSLDLFQLLINNNAPNNHIAELIALNGILADTSYVGTGITPRQLSTMATKAVFKSSKPLTHNR